MGEGRLANLSFFFNFQIEQEVEGIREAHRILEASTLRREGLEKALRVKLEHEIRRLKEEGINLKGIANTAGH